MIILLWYLLVVSLSIAGVFYTKYAKRIRTINQAGTPLLSPTDSAYDVVIVGAGPAGTTAAYYLSDSGKKVLILERKSFPKTKLCGDAWCARSQRISLLTCCCLTPTASPLPPTSTLPHLSCLLVVRCAPALDILEDMKLEGSSVHGCMEQDGAFHSVTRGGFISPFGYQCINTEGAAFGSVSGCRTYAIKRHIGDHYLAKAAIQAGATLIENTEVKEAELRSTTAGDDKMWHISTSDGTEHCSRLLFICDGSTSYLAQKLGIVSQSPPEARCSHRYLADTNWKGENFAADGVMLFNRSVLPGYSALFRHTDEDVYLGTYILPGGQATSRTIAPFEKELITAHPYVAKALGEEHRISDNTAAKMQVAPIRLGGVEKSYAEACLVVGDAAGHVDPLTGEGIHTAMIAARIAALTAVQMLDAGDVSAQNCAVYHWRCWDAFGFEFKYSAIGARLIYAMPIVLDAVAVVGQKRGQPFLDFFGEVMTGVRPKSHFLQPSLAFAVSIELVRQVWLQYVLRRQPLQPDIGVAAVTRAQTEPATKEKSN